MREGPPAGSRGLPCAVTASLAFSAPCRGRALAPALVRGSPFGEWAARWGPGQEAKAAMMASWLARVSAGAMVRLGGQYKSSRSQSPSQGRSCRCTSSGVPGGPGRRASPRSRRPASRGRRPAAAQHGSPRGRGEPHRLQHHVVVGQGAGVEGDHVAGRTLFTLISARYERGSVILTSKRASPSGARCSATGRRHRHPRPAAPSQPRPQHPGRELPPPREEARRLLRPAHPTVQSSDQRGGTNPPP